MPAQARCRASGNLSTQSSKTCHMSRHCRMATSTIAAIGLLAATLEVAAVQPAHPPIKLFLDAGGSDNATAEAAMAQIARAWRDGYASMFIDMARLLVPRRVNAELIPN